MPAFQFDGSQYEASLGGLQVYPEGWYSAVIVETSFEKTKEAKDGKNNNQFLAVTFSLPQVGDKYVERYNVINDDPDTARKACGRLAYLRGVLRLSPQMNQTEDMHNIPLQIYLAVQDNEYNGRKTTQNRMTNMRFADGSEFKPGKVPPPNPQHQNPSQAGHYAPQGPGQGQMPGQGAPQGGGFQGPGQGGFQGPGPGQGAPQGGFAGPQGGGQMPGQGQGPQGGGGFPQQGGGFPQGGGQMPGQGGGFPQQGGGFQGGAPQGGGFQGAGPGGGFPQPGQGAPQGGGFPQQGGGFPGQGGGFPGQGGFPQPGQG